MTIYAIGKFNGVYNEYDINQDLIDGISETIKRDIIDDNSHDPKISVDIRQAHQPSIYGMNGVGILYFIITVLTCLKRIKVRDYDYPWDNIMLADYQTYNDYTYDGDFFHIARNDSERDSGEV